MDSFFFFFLTFLYFSVIKNFKEAEEIAQKVEVFATKHNYLS